MESFLEKTLRENVELKKDLEVGAVLTDVAACRELIYARHPTQMQLGAPKDEHRALCCTWRWGRR